nr:extracellular solute-binding protein [Lachnospiraceae bacterium]
MKKKQLLSLALTAALTMSMLAGCGSNAAAPAADSSSAAGTETTAAAEPVADESGYVYTGEAPITQEEGQSLKILAETSNYSNVDIASARIVTTVVEQAGISVDWQLLDFNSYAEAATPMLTSGNVDADIVLLPDQDDNQVYIKSGLFEPLDSHFESMPNFTAWLNANPELKAQLTAEDGHIYYVPGINVAHDYQPCLMYNQ